MGDWDVKAYERFEKERMQPSIDLVSRIGKNKVESILDIGCGSGMSTKQLVKRWPNATVTGVDYSRSMLEAAEQLGMNVKWLQRDCNESLEDLGGMDLIFSNASLQWLEDHGKVIKSWFACLNKEGIIAVQIPLFEEMAIEKIIKEVSRAPKWMGDFKVMKEQMCHNHTANAYYDLFAKHTREVEMWETDYFHVLESHEAIIDFCKSTGLRPYLNTLDDVNRQEDFLQDVLQKVKEYYKLQEDGKVIFKFKRLFMIAVAQ